MCPTAQLPRWLPVSIMNGGGAANTLVRSLDSGWGRTLFSNTIIRNIGASLYKVRCDVALMAPCRERQLPRPRSTLAARGSITLLVW